MSRVGVAFLVVAIVVVVERRSSGIDIDAERSQCAHLDDYSFVLEDVVDRAVVGAIFRGLRRDACPFGCIHFLESQKIVGSHPEVSCQFRRLKPVFQAFVYKASLRGLMTVKLM